MQAKGVVLNCPASLRRPRAGRDTFALGALKTPIFSGPPPGLRSFPYCSLHIRRVLIMYITLDPKLQGILAARGIPYKSPYHRDRIPDYHSIYGSDVYGLCIALIFTQDIKQSHGPWSSNKASHSTSKVHRWTQQAALRFRIRRGGSGGKDLPELLASSGNTADGTIPSHVQSLVNASEHSTSAIGRPVV